MTMTKFGIELRKLRIDLGVTLFEMASRAGVSSSLLSSAETGKKPATAGLVEKLAGAFCEIEARRFEFQSLADQTIREVSIRLTEEDQAKNEVALAFARNFKNLSDEQRHQLMAIFTSPKESK